MRNTNLTAVGRSLATGLSTVENSRAVCRVSGGAARGIPCSMGRAREDFKGSPVRVLGNSQLSCMQPERAGNRP
jgi:hypothetical protein